MLVLIEELCVVDLGASRDLKYFTYPRFVHLVIHQFISVTERSRSGSVQVNMGLGDQL